MKKTLMTLSALSALLVGGNALADQSYTAYGHVIDARPVYQHVGGHGACRDDHRRDHHRHERHPGNDRDHYRRSAVETKVETGRILAKKVSVETRHVSRESHERPLGGMSRHDEHRGYGDRDCDRRSHQRISGYNVTYRYHGRIYHTFTREHPGYRLTLSVNIRPLER